MEWSHDLRPVLIHDSVVEWSNPPKRYNGTEMFDANLKEREGWYCGGQIAACSCCCLYCAVILNRWTVQGSDPDANSQVIGYPFRTHLQYSENLGRYKKR